jgi:hypothetical protein
MRLPPADRTTLVFALGLVCMLFAIGTEVADEGWWHLFLLPLSLYGYRIIYRWLRDRQAGRPV